MDPRYVKSDVTKAWSNEHKLGLWQGTELAAMSAQVELGNVPLEAFRKIDSLWRATPIDVEWWKARDKEIHHDLNAFLDERLRHLPKELQQYVHKDMTSYDTEESPFARILLECLELVSTRYKDIQQVMVSLARKYRYTLMNARTHGQEAELQSFGARCLTWGKDLFVANETLANASKNLKYSRMSGAIGKYGSIDPELERKALRILGFEPFYGATQIMPRILYAPVAQGLCGLVQVVDKIATDIRLNARSGRPLMREPFKKKQKGSSAMPHKRNPISLEQLKGMARMAIGYMNMITANVATWEERSIEQSSVERVAWPDLFHVTVHALETLTNILADLQVYPENMLLEVYESRGVYASSEVKEFLKEHLVPKGLGYEDVYRIVQLACFNVFEPSWQWKRLREFGPKSYEDASALLKAMENLPPREVVSIREFIPTGRLLPTDELDVSKERTKIYNRYLKDLFADRTVRAQWDRLFEPAFLLKHEATLYQHIIGE